MSNDDNTTSELAKGLGESTKRISVEVVGRLIKDNQMGALPSGSSKADLDTLTTGKTAHTRVRNKLSIETELLAVVLNLLADELTEVTGLDGLGTIDLSDHLGVRANELSTGDPGVVGGGHDDPLLLLGDSDVLTKGERTLVLVRVLELAARVDGDDLALGVLDPEDLVHSLLILLGDLGVGTIHSLAILTSLETPLDVLGRSFIEMVIDMGERMLLDVGDTDVLVLVELTRSGDKLTGEDVDQGGLSGSVGTDNGDTGSERTLEVDVRDLRPGGTGVLEGHVLDLDDGLGLGLDTLEETRLGEGEVELRGTELVVRTSRRNLLGEGLEVTTVTLKLEALVVDDVLADVVQETRIVRHDDGSARRVLEVGLEPLDVLTIHMVGRLVEKENIGLLEHGTGKSQLHLPTTRERGDGSIEHILVEVELEELATEIGVGNLDTVLAELVDRPAGDGLLGIVGIEIVLDEHGANLRLLGETLNLLVVDSAHEGGLAGTVGTAKTVTLATLEAEMGLVEQDLCTVGQVEGAVAEILTLLVIGIVLDLSGTGKGTLAELIGGLLGSTFGEDSGVVRNGVLSPDGNLLLLLVDQRTGNVGDVVEDGLELGELGGVLGSNDLLENLEDDRGFTSRGRLGDNAVLDVTDTGQSLDGVLDLAAGLGVGDVLVVLGETRHELGQERSNDIGILDKLAHVVDNDSSLSLDDGVTLSETTLEERDHDGEGRGVNVLDEDGGTEEVDSLGDVLGLSDTADELRNETVDIVVGDQGAELLHGGLGVLLDFTLGIPHGTGDGGDELGEADSGLRRSVLDKRIEAVEGGHLLGPLGRIGDRGGQVGSNSLDSVGVDGGDELEAGLVGSNLYSGDLVTNGGQECGKERDDVSLETGGEVLSADVCDGRTGVFPSDGILLVGQLLLDSSDGPEQIC